MDSRPAPIDPTPPQAPAVSGRVWPMGLLSAAFVALAVYSVHLAATLLQARCDGFSCTYLGLGWIFWAGIVGLPVTVLGFWAQRSRALPRTVRQLLRLAWLGHSLFAASLLAWWLVHRG